MFERFTQAARDVVVHAQDEARQLRQAPIGTEHLLLALLAQADGPIATAPALRDKGVDHRYVRAEILRLVGHTAATSDPIADADADDVAALKAIGIDLDAVRRAIEENFGPGALQLPRNTAPKRRGLLRRLTGSDHLPFANRSKKVLELSLREAIRLKQNFIAPEHILLGILREGQGLAMRILTEAKVDPVRLGTEVTRSVRGQAA